MRNFIDIITEATDPRDNPAFVRWFGDSKVVDEHGAPLVLYHGTGENIQLFHSSKFIWGSVHPELASTYAEMRQEWHNGSANVLPIFMRIVHPLDADGLPNAVTIRQMIDIIRSQAANTLPDEEYEAAFDALQAGRYQEESGPHYSAYDFWLNGRDMFGADGHWAFMSLFHRAGFDGIRMHEDGHLTFGAFGADQVKSVFNREFGDNDLLSY